VNRDGKVVKAFPNSVPPEDHALRAAVEAELG
jgi:hypothetical protein